ncbi:hypothetical protein Trco_007318 [Trichoderma cornu-damae]|uniref:Uncharacterized protein n=1 Tax=Trichoderma cornu-damae TaxID=654480 RepID=A0A9P8QJU6_9HYPO|nr:hypothetical protein Trco_007318 [Trichoderma cornu-damae]
MTTPRLKSRISGIFVGNFDHSRVMLVISPSEPVIRAVGHDPELVEHRPYDGKTTNAFGGTLSHLSFLPYEKYSSSNRLSLATNPALIWLSIGDQTGSRFLRWLWSYVIEIRMDVAEGEKRGGDKPTFTSHLLSSLD